MNTTYRLIGFIILGIAASAVAGVALEARKRNLMKRLLNTADEGYETAHDIIYPNKINTGRADKLKYGPIHPEM